MTICKCFARILVSALAVVFAPVAASSGTLPQQFLGFHLGEQVQTSRAQDWGVIIHSRRMISVKSGGFDFAPRPGNGVLLYDECPQRSASGCVKSYANPGAGGDVPGTLRLYVAGFAKSRLIALNYELNPTKWRTVSLETADATFRKLYGPATRFERPRREVLTVGAGKIVSATASWSWRDGTTLIYITGSGNSLPGTDKVLDMGPSYRYFLYAEDLALRRQADRLNPPDDDEED